MNEQIKLSGKDQWRLFVRLLGYLQPHKKMIALALFFLFVTVAGNIVAPYLIKIFIDDYLTPRQFPTTPIVLLGAGYMAIQIITMFVTYSQLVRFQKIALLIIQQIRVDVFTKIQKLGMRYFDQTPAGSIVSRVTNDTEAIKEMFVSVLVGFLQSAFLMIGSYIAMFVLDIKLTLISLVLLPVFYIIIRIYQRFSSEFYMDLRERLSQLNAKIAESLQGMSIVQVFRQEERFQDEFNEINEKHFLAGRRNIKLDSLLLRPAIDLLYVIALVLILGYFGFASFDQAISAGLIFAFVSYIDRFFEPINQVIQRLSIFQQAMVASSRVFALLDHKELAPSQLVDDSNLTIEKGKIEFQDVSFSYDGQTEVLKNISFTVNPGETVALVGHTGSGKSSIINLFMRFYEFGHGEIKIDDQSIKQYPMDELRKKVGLVLQDPFLFYGDIASNIRLFGSSMSMETIDAASKFVQADDFIQQLPNKYAQKVTERGSTYSSGQRQLIAFARTMAIDPKILILDEATANIDTETEVAIQSSLKKMREGRTTIAIAHRLSTIQDADLILVLHHGEVVERGTHQQLLQQQGLYHKMYLLQNGIVDEVS